jgi:tRNA threonylcarbamoyladenosine biosynthesis protein TsaE
MTSSSGRLSLLATSVAATHAVAGALAALSRAGDVILLAGEMGAGKTAFAQGFGRALGVTEPITSPTFTLVHSYETARNGRRLTLHHADVYRLEQFAEVADLAFGELAEFDGIVLVEWGDVVAGVLGEHLEVRLDLPAVDAVTDDDDADDDADEDDPVLDTRCITVSASGSTWARRWPALHSALGDLGLDPC